MPCLIEAHGRSYEIEDPDGLIGVPLRAGNPYEARVLEHIYRRGFEGLAVDVGANVGNHSLWFAAVCGLEVEAFEPLTFDELEANLALNELPIVAHEVALGDRDGRAASVGDGALKLDRGGIPVRRLDSYPLDHVALMKVDVEGMEPHVLRGAVGTIVRDQPTIYAEAWDTRAHRRVAGVLEPLGYRHVATFGATPLEEWECSRPS